LRKRGSAMIFALRAMICCHGLEPRARLTNRHRTVTVQPCNKGQTQ
jgi:hypothetical protein